MSDIHLCSDAGSKKARALCMLRNLKLLFPDAKMFLQFSNNWELLVAVELSAQCTDKKVNEITPALFQKYPTLEDYIRAKPVEFEQMIFQSGFYRNKTKNILAAAKIIHDKFGGKIPKTMTEMLSIPGVARKTANVVLGNAYGIVEGVAVDTHVKRLASVLGLSSEKDPNKIEKDLMALFPKKEWFYLTYLLIEFGRTYCPARKHDHDACRVLLGLKH
ncbi:MAG: endonuclease III [Candidatus Lloydbacteria bacterium RIFCSPHIGHO2_01_FULL_49_22]|uniref:Endonuclease III n=1 Tax=Candidatus Lloydbacteria bacterium RIFCSPHIGHO2_01_FULL_49_22 TaxID=1798658 RepID=A0A1G2CXX5_9BACT|nr:MAG: endonuclease III [Candidatus Lloydbacteria bacterium RIFCSPHIGHO2_01_FULL_49_22]OGZ09310.1 MAG: endonuclease III [Candidatus Lloydbacteria bacterium RIFCSPHIGHO2_02_FULL_50_18]